jgi:hypothetical protein
MASPLSLTGFVRKNLLRRRLRTPLTLCGIGMATGAFVGMIRSARAFYIPRSKCLGFIFQAFRRLPILRIFQNPRRAMICIRSLTLLVMLLPVAAPASEGPAPLILARKQVETADYRMNGHLIRVDEKGARISYGINVRAHWFPGILRVAFEVVSPADARARVLLEMRSGGASTIQIAHPGDAKVATLPFEKWSEGPLGAGFSYEDFLISYFWPLQEAQGKAKFGMRNCDVLVSKPGATDRTHYAEVKSWLDPQSGFPVHVEKTMKDAGIVKEFTYFGLRQSQGVWYASQIEAKIRGHAGSTLLVIDRGNAKAHLDIKDFSSAQLTHF